MTDAQNVAYRSGDQGREPAPDFVKPFRSGMERATESKRGTLSPEAAARLRARLDAYAEARARSLVSARDVWVR